MAPVDIPEEYDALPFLLGLGYFGLVNITLFFIVSSLGRAYLGLPVSLRTRFQTWERRKEVLIFAVFAITSLTVYIYHVIDEIASSYQQWALERRLHSTEDVWSSPAWSPFDSRRSTAQFGEWLRDTGWLQRNYGINAFRHRDLWWMQQKAWAIVIWTHFIAIQGRRRNVPHVWAYQLLSSIAGLAPAQNLFNIALILTPVPLHESESASGRESRTREASTASHSRFARARARISNLLSALTDQKPPSWTPNPLFSRISLITSAICITALPYAGDNATLAVIETTLMVATMIPSFVNTSALVPTTWGTFHTSVHEAHHAAGSTFETASILSLIVHVVSTAGALRFDPIVELLKEPHSASVTHYTFPWLRKNKSVLDKFNGLPRPRLMIPRLLAALSDHPTVRKVAWDVLMAGPSLCVWSVMRGLQARDIMSVVGLPAQPSQHSYIAAAAASASGHSRKRSDAAAGSTVKSSRALKKAPAMSKAPQHEHEEEREEVDVRTATESAAFIWGLLIVGGLGLGIAGVCGAECVM